MSEPRITSSPDLEFTVDELAARAGIPVRTIREYQAEGLVPSPERRGRVGIYRPSHLTRLQLIGRLQSRGYSLAAIRELLRSWSDGADLGEVLGLEVEELVHLDEPGRPATVAQLALLLPTLIPARLDDLVATGLIEPYEDGRLCVPSPSLLQLTVDAIAAGYDTDAVVSLLRTVCEATATIADATLALLSERPAHHDPDKLISLATKARGLLAHGTGRLTVHTIGRRLGVDRDGDLAPALAQFLEVEA
jgi:DNA-binding transcriptional MerR regulator